MKVYIKYLPFTIGLTASLPNPISNDYKIIKTIFGEPIVFKSEITKIPVYFTDYRDTIEDRGFCDVNYVALNDQQAFDHYSNLMLEKNITPSIDYKLIVITSSIDTTVYCGINACIKFNLPVLILRANNESSFFLTPIRERFLSVKFLKLLKISGFLSCFTKSDLSSSGTFEKLELSSKTSLMNLLYIPV